MKIDLHCHFCPTEYLEELRKHGLKGRAGPEIEKLLGFQIPLLWESAEARIAEMDKVGIDTEVLSLSAPNVYFDDDKFSLAMAQMCNDRLAEICYKYSDRFRGFASVPLGNVAYAVEELKRSISNLGLAGVVLGTNINGRPLNSQEFMPFYKEVDKLMVPVFIHPMSPIIGAGMQEYRLDFLVGFLFETTIAVAKMVFSGIFDRYQNVKLILSHLGGTIPFIFNRMDLGFKSYPECREDVSDLPSAYFKRFYYDTAVSFTKSSLMCACDLVGADHIVFGTDYPFAWGLMPKTIAGVQELAISKEAKELIFHKNAEGLRGLKLGNTDPC